MSPTEFREDLHTLRTRVLLAAGDVEAASAWADQVIMDGEDRLHPQTYRFTLACVRSAQGRHAEVEALLSGALPETESGNIITRRIETDLLLAAALAGQERRAEALQLIEDSLILAEPEGYVRVFLDAGESARNLLSAYTRLDGTGKKDYALKILQTFASEERAELPSPASGILSDRELDVLEWMALGLTNQEIAGRLFLASGTVKAHAASIYRKLDAANRTEAVNHARQRDIIS